MQTKTYIKTIFYIVPHADDWQLFMNPETFKDIRCSQNKIIFIITTAGDAGMGNKFWRSREQGMKASVLYCFKPGIKLLISECYKKFKDGWIYFWSVNNVSSYFLRLPDGGVTGEGFERYNYNNLQKLETGAIISLRALDNNLSLKSWSCFRSLLSEIILSNFFKYKGKLFIKFLNPDFQSNPLDHADHQSTGRGILALDNLPSCTKVVFNGYGNSCRMCLTPDELFWKSGIFAVYENVVFESTGYSTLAENVNLYKKWILARPEFKTLYPR